MTTRALLWCRLATRASVVAASPCRSLAIPEGNPTQRAGASLYLSWLHLKRGRLVEGEREWARAGEANVARGGRPDSVAAALASAFIDIWYRERPEAGLRTLEGALGGTTLRSLPLQHPLSRESYYLVLARTYAQAGRPERARSLVAQFDAEVPDTAFRRASAPVRHRVLGEIALAEGRPLVALEEFRRGDRLPDGPASACAICLHAYVGRAFDQANQPDSAITAFERYLETPQLNRVVQDATYAAGILKRLGELYEGEGDRVRAASYYARFLTLWKDADPELQPKVTEVRQRLDRLQAGERR